MPASAGSNTSRSALTLTPGRSVHQRLQLIKAPQLFNTSNRPDSVCMGSVQTNVSTIKKSAVKLLAIVLGVMLSKLHKRKQAPKQEEKTKMIVMERAIPAGCAVLNTLELLELILAHLPMRDLLLCQRVCKDWRACVKESLLLQRLLFLAPTTCEAVSWIDWRFDDRDMYRLNELGDPLRPSRGPLVKRGLQRYPRHWGNSRSDDCTYQVFVNPMLAQRFPVLSPDGVHAGPKLHDLPPSYKYPTATWKKMSITHPMIETMFIEWDNDEDNTYGLRQHWTVDTLCRHPGAKGISAHQLLQKLSHTRGIAWIEGSESWKWFGGLHDLYRLRRQRVPVQDS